MKKIIFLLLISFSAVSQTKILSEYKSKSGSIIKVNDSINIAYPRSGNAFTFITQGNQPAGSIIANTSVKITKIKSIKNKTYILFKGYGALPVFVDYESALETGEIR